MNKNILYHNGTRSEMVDFIPDNYSKVLEIGCGEGGFKKNLLEECEYWGIEPYEEAASIAEKSIDKVLIGTFEDVLEDLPDNYFDLIICNDVIEHMNDHHKFYELIQKKCMKNSHMIGSMPNVRYIMNLYELLIKKDWLYRDEGILDRTHLRFFTLKSIIRDFENFDFVIEKLYGINKIVFSWKRLSGLKMNCFQFVMGKDTQFLQFGFRIKLR